MILKDTMAYAEILIAEDEPAARRLFEAALGRAGFKVTLAASAEEAIERLGEARFDLLITDKNMPGADGLELLSHVRQNYRDLRTILITGYPSWDSRMKAVEFGADAYMMKPFDLRELVATVQTALAGQKAA